MNKSLIVFLLLLSYMVLRGSLQNKTSLPFPNTEYGGEVLYFSDKWLQNNELSCGVASVSYLLSNAGYEYSQDEIAKKMDIYNFPREISFNDMSSFLKHEGFRIQAIHVDPSYFKQNSAQGIMHLDNNHFLVFIGFIDSRKVKLFDPAEGIVIIPYRKLIKKWTGNFLYVYK